MLRKTYLIILVTLFCGIKMIHAQDTSKMNLLFIITDQQRFDALGYAGNTVIKTPNLDRLALEGAYFSNAYTPCAVCGPARSSILTGSTVEHTGVFTNDITYYNDREGVMAMPTFDEILNENGYHCEYYGKWHAMTRKADVYKNPAKYSNDGKYIFGSSGGQSIFWHEELDALGAIPSPVAGEFIDGMSKYPYEANPLDRFYGKTFEELLSLGLTHSQPDQHGKLQLDKDHTLTAFQAKQTLEAINRLKDSTFSITCSFHFPHSPMLAPEPFYGMYPVNDMVPPVSINDIMTNSPYVNSNSRQSRTEYADPNKIKYMISEYYGLITEIDDWVGKILDTLDALGIADKTMVIFTSDHGEMLGAHGMREKNIFYDESSHVPLLVKVPGKVPAETKVDEYVSLIDLFSTILDYTKVPQVDSDGKSLRGLIEETDTTYGKYVVTEWVSNNISNYMIVKDGWKLIIPYTITSPVINAMYDQNTDPHEINNLLGSNPNKGDYIEKAEELRSCLVEWLAERNSIHTYSVAHRDLLIGGKGTGNNAAFISQVVPPLNSSDTVSVTITMKNTGSTTWTKAANIKLGSQGPSDNLNWGINRIELESGDSIAPGEEKTFTFDVIVPDIEGIFVFQWQLIQEGEEWFGSKSDMKQIIFGDPGSYLDNCDALSDWKSSSALILNTVDQQQGEGCIEFSAASTDEFKKVFSPAYNSRGSVEYTELRFWYYVSDASLMGTNNQVELGSGGKADLDEYNWNIGTLTNGWNLIVLKISEAGKIGSPNLNAINWIRIYNKKSGVVTTRIDGIQLFDPTAEKTYTLLVNNGLGGGSYVEGEVVNITANASSGTKIFDKWVIESGNPFIADVFENSTTLTMGNSSAVISPSYRETIKYNVVVNNGSGSGDYYAGSSVVIQADNISGEVFERWIVNTGTVGISNENASLTYFTMPEEDVEITAWYQGMVGINLFEAKDFNLYPNPAQSEVSIDFSLYENSEVNVFLQDVLGRQVRTFIRNERMVSGAQKLTCSLDNITKGLYFLNIVIDKQQITKSIIVE